MSKATVAISQDFFNSFAALPKNKQNKVMEFLSKFRSNPEANGFNYEKIQNASDPNMRLGIILRTLSEISQHKFYEATMLVDVLRGSHGKKILADHLDQASGYGKLSGIARDDVLFLVDWLIQNGFALKTRGPYPVLHPTYNGEHYGEVITRQKLQALRTKLQATEIGLV